MLAMQPPGQSVVVIGATNRPDAIDSALRRAGRFDREIAIGIPDEGARESILRVLAQKLRLDGDFEFVRIAKKTSGYVGADLNALTQEAASIAVSRILDSVMDTERLSQEQLDRLSITMNDFEAALKVVQPSAKREGFAMVPDVSWDDIGALEELRKELTMAIALPIACPTLFKSVGLSAPMGVLLFGPPGCGKTLVAKAVANQSGASFISIKGPELLNKYVGESERGIRLLFQRARSSTPCVIFFDELDALCPKRGNGGPSSDSVSERVVNQLLTEMDGLDGRKQVFVIAATNRPDIIDPAMLRPGRLDKLIYVPLPSAEGRLAILSKATRKMPLAQDVNLEEIAASPRCNGFSGADVVSLAREAAQIAIREKTSLLEESFEDVDQDVVISRDHFHQALTRVFPSVSDKQRQRYDSMFSVLCSSRATIQANAE
jgi:ribosome biogenesis ATPase